MYLFQVKTPAESHYAFDDLKLVATIPGDQAFMPLSQSKCPLVK
jgi:branched-chain amino acid transport system substrate-binding protein